MRRLVCAVLLFGMGSAPLQGQGLRDQIRNLFRFGNCGQFICLQTSFANHQEHFEPDADTSGTELINFLSNAIATSISNIPVGATSSGATFTIGPNGIPEEQTGSSGPIYGERSQTLGRGRLLIGFDYTQNDYESVRGIKLSNLNLTLTHEDTPPVGLGDPQFEYDTVGIHTDLRTPLSAFSLRMSYGLSNRVDIGVVVPILNLTLSGRSIGTIGDVETPPAHYFAEPSPGVYQLVDTAHASGSASGIGDIAVRAKVNVFQSARVGFALLGETWLPTGNYDNLLGAGRMAVAGEGIASATFGAVSPHVNAGYVYRASATETSAILTTVGADAAAGSRVTFAGDLIGQWQAGPPKIQLPADAHYIDGSVIPRTTIPVIPDNIIDGSLGAKFLIGARVMGVANVMVPLTNGGMQSNFIWTLGVEKNF
jgi:Putative MetA-pathway of phenol degradation